MAKLHTRQRVKVMGELTEFIEKVVVKVSVNATAFLGEDTPKLTGWAASNWVPAIDRVNTTPFGSKEDVSESAKQAAIGELITTYAFPQIVHITNPVYYILDLNDGTSAKAPRYFVETAIAKAVKTIV